MEKAYDKVWKDGLQLKLQKSGVMGCMYQWISQYLTNRKARVHVNGTYSRKKTLKGVPRGGVFSPTLFLVFINDIVREMPRKVLGDIYVDDLVLWCSEEHLSTAKYSPPTLPYPSRPYPPTLLIPQPSPLSLPSLSPNPPYPSTLSPIPPFPIPQPSP